MPRDPAAVVLARPRASTMIHKPINQVKIRHRELGLGDALVAIVERDSQVHETGAPLGEQAYGSHVPRVSGSIATRCEAFAQFDRLVEIFDGSIRIAAPGAGLPIVFCLVVLYDKRTRTARRAWVRRVPYPIGRAALETQGFRGGFVGRHDGLPDVSVRRDLILLNELRFDPSHFFA